MKPSESVEDKLNTALNQLALYADCFKDEIEAYLGILLAVKAQCEHMAQKSHTEADKAKLRRLLDTHDASLLRLINAVAGLNCGVGMLESSAVAIKTEVSIQRAKAAASRN